MIDHLSFGVSDLARTRRFYDAVLGALGLNCLYADEDCLGYGSGRADFWLLRRARPVPADPDSGLHLSFAAPDRDAVDAFHAAALGRGGADHGAPGLRNHYGPGYYAAFVTDPDGYRIEAHCEWPAAA